MSATFKNSKKKLLQSEVRKFMNELKVKQKEFKKIDSPLAKYNDKGQLTCVLCKSIVRSEVIWTVHINTKQHKEKIALARKLKKEKCDGFATSLKRSLSPHMPGVPEKKIKGILKNSAKIVLDDSNNSSSKINNNLPEDFFDLKTKEKVDKLNEKRQNEKHEKVETETITENKDLLPEGFFDDPKLDAKARNQEYKDPIEEEWEKFVKVIKEADNESNAIIAGDQEEATTERQINEIDEQMKKLSRVLDLERKKVEIISVSNVSKNIEKNEDDEVENDNFDEYLDWRSKKSF